MGIDIGSRAIKLVVVDNGVVVEIRQADTGYDPMAEARKLLQGLSYDRILATGYGRGQFKVDFDAPTVTEIKAHASGARFFSQRRLRCSTSVARTARLLR